MSKEIQFLLYSLPDEEGKVQVVIKDETLWCTQKAMAQLFGVGVPAISKHLGHIFEEGELDRTTTVSKMEIVYRKGCMELLKLLPRFCVTILTLCLVLWHFYFISFAKNPSMVPFSDEKLMPMAKIFRLSAA